MLREVSVMEFRLKAPRFNSNINDKAKPRISNRHKLTVKLNAVSKRQQLNTDETNEHFG